MNGYPDEWPEIAARVREEAGNRCVRCRHRSDRQWKALILTARHSSSAAQIDNPLPSLMAACDDACDPDRHRRFEPVDRSNLLDAATALDMSVTIIERVPQRVLTVHHLNEVKADCDWWNLAALCQVCHLVIQGKVEMSIPYIFDHSGWFQPYVAGYYAKTFLGADLTREEVSARLGELLALGAPK